MLCRGAAEPLCSLMLQCPVGTIAMHAAKRGHCRSTTMLPPGARSNRGAHQRTPVLLTSAKMQSANAQRSCAKPFRAGGARTARPVAPVQAVKDVFMPALSSTMTEGKVVSWLKAEGDKVTKGEALVVVESDKADMDVESFEEGYLGFIVVEEGEMAAVGSPIAFIAETEAEIGEAKAKGGAASNGNAAAAPKEEVKARSCEPQIMR